MSDEGGFLTISNLYADQEVLAVHVCSPQVAAVE